MILADQIRQHVITTYIEPAREAKRDKVSLTSGQVHSALNLCGKFSTVCGALDARKFCEENRIKLVKRSGPDHGATAEWTFTV